jgi:DNA-nicking Smr family endonuclease
LYDLKQGTEMKSGKKPTEDAEDFRVAMAGVRPLKDDNRISRRRPRSVAVPAQFHRDEAAVLQELLQPATDPAELETGEELLYLRPGYPPQLLRQLRRGVYSCGDCIDLHTMTEKVAREVLLLFIAQANRRRLGCVRVIHGKGLRSQGRPVLKLMAQSVLRKHPSVIAFASCRPVNGGTGAVDILLKASGLPAR